MLCRHRVVKLVSKERHTNHRDSMVSSLQHSIHSSMANEQTCLWMTENVVLWKPGRHFDVVAKVQTFALCITEGKKNIRIPRSDTTTYARFQILIF